MNKVLFVLFLFSVLIQAQQQDTLTTASGLKYIVVQKGDGPKAELNKNVEVHYTGYLQDGKIFDSSRERGEPIEFVLGAGQVIKGWDEGIALMSVGDQLRLIIPPVLGYGEKGAGTVIPANATLIFDVELMGVSNPKVSISEALLEEIISDSIDACVRKYHDLKKNHYDEYNFKESQLNQLGYQLLQVGKTAAAIALFRLNIESYPNSSNAYDSMAEAYAMTGNKEEAIKNYQKSLELNPNNNNAKEKLKSLSEGK